MSLTDLTEHSNRLRRWIKARDNRWAWMLYRLIVTVRSFSIPVVPLLHAPLYAFHRGVVVTSTNIKRIFWHTPLFQTRLETPARGLYLYGGMPLLLGNLTIRIGANCRVAGRINLTGRTLSTSKPLLTIGDNCDIGWANAIAVGTVVSIGNNVRLASNIHLAGYPGHPVDAAARARGEPDTADQTGDIVLEDDVWLATGVTVLRGVRIGRGTIVGAGSVVTKDLPPFVLAAGNPARVIRSIAATEVCQTPVTVAAAMAPLAI